MVSPEIAQFAERVRRALSHLPADHVAELTDGLEANMAASVADGTPLPDVDTYVSQLLTAAGLEVPKGSATFASSRPIVDALTSAWRTLATWSRGLAPMWWFLRAFFFVVIVGDLTKDYDVRTAGTQYISVGRSTTLGIVLLAVAIVVSVWWGRSSHKLPSWIEVILGAALVVFGSVIIRDEMHSAELAAGALHAQGGQCLDIGYDSMGRIEFPTEPVPDLIGLDSAEADQAIVRWGRGVAMLSASSWDPLAPSVDGEEWVVVDQSDPYLRGGLCPSIIIDVRFGPMEALPTATSTTSTVAPTVTSTVPQTTTSLLDTAVTPTMLPGDVTVTSTARAGVPTTSNPRG